VRGRAITGVDWSPRSVSFIHHEPASTERHQRLFRAPVRFSQPHDALAFDRALLARPLLTAEPALAGVLERQAELLLTRLPPQGSLRGAVRRALLPALPGGEPRIERVAKALAMTPRTLQRRLSEDGITFQGLLDDLRRELANHYLQGQGRPAAEVAFLLGFADPSAFRRAFKRWTGSSPGGRPATSRSRGG
jgi:AraC-like DNA-binding protein